jgi:hypothetical protein
MQVNEQIMTWIISNNFRREVHSVLKARAANELLRELELQRAERKAATKMKEKLLSQITELEESIRIAEVIIYINYYALYERNISKL